MDAVEFIKAKERMCMYYQECGRVGCPSYDHREILCKDVTSENAEKAVEIVEEWLKTHPVKTNAEKIEELTGTKIKVALFGDMYFVDLEIDGHSYCGVAKLKEWLESEYVEK